MVQAKIFPGELIGKKITIISAANQSMVGWQCQVIDETKNSLKVSHQGKIKTLLKTNLVFNVDGTEMIISGNQLNKRPEDRIKGR